jgi:hypothetical protein
LLGNVAYVALTVNGSYAPGAWNNIFWMIGYASPGIAALLPDMKKLTEPTTARNTTSSARLVVLAGALLLSTATACFSATHAGDLQLFLAALPVPAVVLWRLRGVLRELQRAVVDLEREATRHALVAAIGQRALDGGPIEELVDEGCRQLGDALGVRVEARVGQLAAGADRPEPGCPSRSDRAGRRAVGLPRALRPARRRPGPRPTWRWRRASANIVASACGAA